MVIEGDDEWMNALSLSPLHRYFRQFFFSLRLFTDHLPRPLSPVVQKKWHSKSSVSLAKVLQIAREILINQAIPLEMKTLKRQCHNWHETGKEAFDDNNKKPLSTQVQWIHRRFVSIQQQKQ